MASTFTTRLRIEKIGSGEQSGSWGVTENTQRDLIDIALAGYLEIAMADANVTLTTANGATDQARYHIIKLTGTNTATRELIAPAVSKTYVIENGTTQSVSVKTSGGTAVTIPTGVTAYVFCDGTDFALASAYDSTQIQILNSVTPAADRLLYFTGASAGALATFTSFGRSLVDDADASAGRTTLGLGSLAVLSTINNSNWSGTALAVANGGTGSATAADARTALGLAIGTNVQAYSANLAAWSAVAPSSYTATGSDTTYAYRANNLSDLASASTARTNLGLGSLATLSAVNNSHWSGTALAVANGGTGATTAAAARSALGLEIGTNVQAFSDNLLAEAGLSASADTMSYYTAAGTKALTGLSSFIRTLLDDTTAATARATLGVSEGGTALQVASNLSDLNNVATARTNLGLGSLAVLNAVNNDNWSGTDLGVTNGGTGASDASTARSNLGLAIGTNVQAYSANLAAWSAVAPGSYTATGSDTTYAYRANNLSDLASASTARTNLGLGTAAVANTGTSGATIPLLNGGNNWSGLNVFSVAADEQIRINRTSGYISFFNTAGDDRHGYILQDANTLYIVNEQASGISMSAAGGGLTYNSVAIPTISSTDTLSNKTLASPTLSGTVAGSVTASGAWTFGNQVQINYATPVLDLVGTSTNIPVMQLRNASRYDRIQNTTSGLHLGINYSGTEKVFLIATGGVSFDGVAIPTISSTDTLSNKTISSPTLSGTVAGSPTASGNWTFSSSAQFTGTSNGPKFANPYWNFYAADGSRNGYIQFLDGSSASIVNEETNGSINLVPNGTGVGQVGGVTISTASNTLTLSNKTLSSPTVSGTVAGNATFSGSNTWTGSYNLHYDYGLIIRSSTSSSATGVRYQQSDGVNRWDVGFNDSDDSYYINRFNSSGAYQDTPIAITSAGDVTFRGIAVPTVSSTSVLTNKQIRTPISSETTGSLTSASANKTVQCTGGVTLANSVFTAGDMIVLDPGTSDRTITRGSGVTMYVNGTDVASATLAANKMGGVFWRSASVCVLSGAIS